MLEGWEWIIIGGVAIVIIMWGPAKIPEFARALGRAKGEFNNASKEFENAATMTTSATTVTAAPVKSVSAPRVVIKTKDEILLDTAHSLGIETEGKTQQQISEEISMRVKELSEDQQ
jgi:sec-independent protein translocase protein TatA